MSVRRMVLSNRVSRYALLVLDFADTTAREIMTPRIDVIAMEIQSLLKKRSGSSMRPVFPAYLSTMTRLTTSSPS